MNLCFCGVSTGEIFQNKGRGKKLENPRRNSKKLQVYYNKDSEVLLTQNIYNHVKKNTIFK